MSHSREPRDRAGLTLLELLVVLAITAVLLGLLLPAIQKVRETADRLKCASQLRQIGVGLHSFHTAQGGFPPAHWTLPDKRKVSVHWIPYIFPYIGEENLFKRYNFDVRFSDRANDTGVNQTDVPLLVCPSAPLHRLGRNNHRITDYSATCAVDRANNVFLNPIPPVDPTFLGVMGLNVKRRINDILDGASNTLIVAEDAGQPQQWILGKMVNPKGANGAWTNPENILNIAGFNPVTQLTPGPVCDHRPTSGQLHHGQIGCPYAAGFHDD